MTAARLTGMGSYVNLDPGRAVLGGQHDFDPLQTKRTFTLAGPDSSQTCWRGWFNSSMRALRRRPLPLEPIELRLNTAKHLARDNAVRFFVSVLHDALAKD